MVSNKAADKTVRNEVNVGKSPALTHPHICKTYATRCMPLTDSLFDCLEEHRRGHLQHLAAIRAQQTPPQGREGDKAKKEGKEQSPPAPPQPVEQQAREAAPAAAAARPRPRRRRVLTFAQLAPGSESGEIICTVPPPAKAAGAAQAEALRPLESRSPLGVLHEALVRQGAALGQVVTLVVMEYLCKGHLGRAIHRGVFQACEHWNLRVARRALVRSFAEVARAMLHLHKAGVVHGDLKPANVGLNGSRDDRRGFVAKVCDFGLAHVLPAGAKSLDTDSMGTPAYMAPEALMGHVGKASDVWSFGVMLCEALTRNRPYGKDIDAARLVLGIMDGSLLLRWPKLPAEEEGEEALLFGGTAAAFLARHNGAFFARAASSVSAAGDRRAGSTLLDSCDTVNTVATGTTTTVAYTTTPTGLDLTSTAGDMAPAVSTVSDTAAGGSTACSQPGPGLSRGGGRSEESDQDPVLPLLVRLGRRCTAPDPDDRPCFSEILGELIDMEIILKAHGPRGGRTADAHDAVARACARSASSRAPAPAAAVVPPVAPLIAPAPAVPAPAPTVVAPPPPVRAATRTAEEFRALVEAQLAALQGSVMAPVAQAPAPVPAAAVALPAAVVAAPRLQVATLPRLPPAPAQRAVQGLAAVAPPLAVVNGRPQAVGLVADVAPFTPDVTEPVEVLRASNDLAPESTDK